MKLRPATARDAAAISGLIRSLSHKLTASPSGEGAEEFFARISTEAVSGRLAAANFVHLVAEENSQVVGVVAMRDHRHLFHLFIAEASQGKGIGRALWLAARDGALASGNPGNFTVNSTPNAIGVYERFGFICVGSKVVQHGISFVPMRLVAGANGV
jgi:GNAT superfamily N-acetyltransferase